MMSLLQIDIHCSSNFYRHNGTIFAVFMYIFEYFHQYHKIYTDCLLYHPACSYIRDIAHWSRSTRCRRMFEIPARASEIVS